MQISVPHDHENFSVIKHPTRDWLLIKPTGVKQKWTEDERWWRSMVTDLDGNVLSAGLPKFHNLGEKPPLDAQLSLEIERTGGRLVYTEKLDGSLAIRSVIDGEVVWRTRGIFGTEADNELLVAIKQEAAKYPKLADPTYNSVVSIHFEFQHPDFQIILPVIEPKLTLISAVNHDLQLARYAWLGLMAEEIGCERVGLHYLPSDLNALLEAVKAWEDKEGIVAHFDDEQRYVKIKSAQYLAQHRLRFAFTPANAIEMCKMFNFETADEFIEHLYGLGLDWEIASERVRWFTVFDTAREFAAETISDVSAFVDTYGDLYEDKATRKRYAELVVEAYDDQMMRTSAFMFASGKANAEEAYGMILDKTIEAMLKTEKVEA